MKIAKLFSKEELKDIIISVLAITLIFSYPDFSQFPFFLGVVIIAFLFHELAHRFVARRFGCVAFYKMWWEGIALGLVFMFMKPYGFIPFVAPGAVVIYPFRFGRWGYRRIHLTEVESGLISLAGPSVNLFFAVFFKLFSGDVFSLISFVNAWLALFNLLPIPPLDGSKILRWKMWIWFVLFVISIVLIAPYFGLL